MDKVINKTITIVSMILGYFVYLIGGFDDLIKILLLFNCIDFFTGLLKGYVNKNLNSNKIFVGGYRKIVIYIVIIIANSFDSLNENFFLRETVVLYYISMEALSIFENIGEYIEIPDNIKNVFTQLNNETKGDDKLD